MRFREGKMRKSERIWERKLEERDRERNWEREGERERERERRTDRWVDGRREGQREWDEEIHETDANTNTHTRKPQFELDILFTKSVILSEKGKLKRLRVWCRGRKGYGKTALDGVIWWGRHVNRKRELKKKEHRSQERWTRTIKLCSPFQKSSRR